MKQSTFLRSALRALVNDGWKLVDIEGVPAGSVDSVVKEARQYDHAVIDVEKDGKTSFLLIVWQGCDDTYQDGEEIISDYGMKLDAVLSPLYEGV